MRKERTKEGIENKKLRESKDEMKTRVEGGRGNGMMWT